MAAALTGALPRLRLASLPTPLEPAPRLGARLGGGVELSIKREDQSGLALGGNKPRQLEVILAEARSRGADTVITTAGSQSNFCRAMAAGAARLGLRCVLLLRGDGRAEPTGNLLLDRLFGAEVRFIDTADPYDPAVRARLDELAEAVRRRGGAPYVVQLPGATGPLAAAAAVGLAEELAAQWASAAAPPEAVYLAVGSGLTAAGLTLGLKALGLPTRVVGISVQQPAAFIAPLIVRRANEAAALLGLGAAVDGGDVEIDDGFLGPGGYGRPSAPGLAAMVEAARLEGLVLDPVYTGKALAGLIAHADAGRFGTGRRPPSVVFLHSGGGPGLFVHARAVADHLAAGG